VSPEDDARSFGEQADRLLERIAPILAGQLAELQGAVVADLAAIWIAGHRNGSRAEGDAMREELIEMHTRHVRELVCAYLGDIDG